MSDTPTVSERFLALPRATQWAILAAIGLVLFLAYDSYVLPAVDSWNRQAEQIERNVELVRSSEAWMGDFRRHAVTYGSVKSPGTLRDGDVALNRAVNEVLDEYTVSDKQFQQGGSGTLPRGSLPTLARGDRRVSRIATDVSFVCNGDDAIAIVSDLESHPDIESISEVRIRTRDRRNRRVDVHLVVEAWVITEK